MGGRRWQLLAELGLRGRQDMSTRRDSPDLTTHGLPGGAMASCETSDPVGNFVEEHAVEVWRVKVGREAEDGDL